MPVTQSHIDAYIKAHNAIEAAKAAIASELVEGEQRSTTNDVVHVWQKLDNKLVLVSIPPLLG